ncbi:uncharacterized protein [Lepeophtheirus salmonis]|uniref:uncharacterized protein n=1 Tax=Lepeophtheirus salmonis TaxID=72036 RepID=UPI001AE56FB7|nr:uncharacterized protein LOC121115689 [Lepeophtheirus salmonis]
MGICYSQHTIAEDVIKKEEKRVFESGRGTKETKSIKSGSSISLSSSSDYKTSPVINERELTPRKGILKPRSPSVTSVSIMDGLVHNLGANKALSLFNPRRKLSGRKKRLRQVQNYWEDLEVSPTPSQARIQFHINEHERRRSLESSNIYNSIRSQLPSLELRRWQRTIKILGFTHSFLKQHQKNNETKRMSSSDPELHTIYSLMIDS